MRSLAITLVILTVGMLYGHAQDSTATTSAPTSVTIVDHITAVGGNTIVQPDGLLKRLFPIVDTADNDDNDEKRGDTPAVSSSRPAGWRVQVFSDNNPRTAKAEAAKKERLISARFPQHQAYVRYNAPYWRLRIGDFKSQQEANAVADELRKAFPAYSKEIRVVRDRITLPSD